MAVEQNKRKRKHEATALSEDEEGTQEVVPKKQSKKFLTPKKDKTAKGKENSATVSGLEEEEKELHFSKDFKMMEFRQKLRGNNFITELRHFLHLCHNRAKTIVKYIEKRGKPLEFAEALERIDKTNVLHIAYICEALQLVILEILSNQRNHLESAVHASRYFLKSHGNLLELLLKSGQLNHRKIALKLLTAIVCVEPQLGRQVLTSYDILSNVKTINKFLSHSLNDGQQQQQQKQKQSELDSESVRKCFIHFVLAYLMDGNTLLIRNILDRGSLIRALAGGLVYDDSVTVCVVLSTLKKFVLENLEISKTKKIHVFDLDCCKSFVQLYDWRGPRVFNAQHSGKKGAAKNLSFVEMQEMVNDDEREAVSKAVHEFLLVLLTSRKNGIAFDTVRHFRQKHNTIQGQILGYVQYPWNNERKKDLVIKVLEACPDLFRNTVRNFAGIINPLRTASRFWLQACEFLTTIILVCHPRHFQDNLAKLSLTDCVFYIKDICLPLETLVHIKGSKFLMHNNFQQRLATNRLLLAMFQQYTNYLKVINEKQTARESSGLRKFKFDILNHLLLNFPTMESILDSLNVSIQRKATKEVDVLGHLEVALDLILIICQENRTFVNRTSIILDYLELLRPLYSQEDEEEEINTTSNTKLEMKAIKTILLLSPKALEPQKNRFSSVLRSLIKGFVYGEREVSQEAGCLLRNIFKNTGIFDAGEFEIDLWLETLKFVDLPTVNVVTQVFNEVLKVTKAEVEMPKAVESLNNESNLRDLFENIERGYAVYAYGETISMSKLLPLIYKGVEIEPPLSKYLELVCFLMFHYYPCTRPVVKLYQQQFSSMNSYMNNWLSREICEETDLLLESKKAAKCITGLKDVQNLILFGGKEFEQIFESKSEEDVCEYEFKGQMKKFSKNIQNSRLITIYIQHVFFAMQHLKQKRILKQEQAKRSSDFVIQCLSLISKYAGEEEEIFKEDNETLKRESLLQKIVKYFYSVRLDCISSTEMITGEAYNESLKSYLIFLKDLTQYCNKLDNFNANANNFKTKLSNSVALSLMNKDLYQDHTKNFDEFLQLLDVFQLSKEQCMEILNLLVDNSNYKDYFFMDEHSMTLQKTSYYFIMVLMLQRLASLQRGVICENFIAKFNKLYCNFFKKLTGDFNIDQLEEAFHDFLVVNHGAINYLDNKFFLCFFGDRKLSKASIKLATLIYERHLKYDEIFLHNLENILDKKELTYPLLAVAFKKKLPVPSYIMQKIYQTYKNGFMRTIEKPLKAGMIYKDYVSTSLKLIEASMPLNECRDFCNKQFKFENIETYQLRTIFKIYEKAFLHSDATQKSSIFSNFITLHVQMLALDLKMQKLNQEKLEIICYHMELWFKYGWQQEQEKAEAELEPEAEGETENEKSLLFNPDFSKLLKSQQWLQFCKACLKTAMHVSETEVEDQQVNDGFNGLLLQLLAYLSDNLYSDYTEEATDSTFNMECGQLFEMIFSHSKFYEIVLQKPSLSKQKTQVLHLLYVMAQKFPSCLKEQQIPVILGAYQARLYHSDRYCLALLTLYEHFDCGLSQYRPFIWGESAIAFYALRASDDDERLKLSQQETSIQQVMSLVDYQICEYTLDNFPIWRKLNTVQQLPEEQFVNPFTKAWQFGANALEQKLERGETEFTQMEMRLCPKRYEIYEQCYDPSFFLPLMAMCFAPEAFTHTARPVQNGLLAVSFAALSSQDKEMRQLAGCVQLRYRHHFENSKFFEKPLWQQAYENIQSGLNDLRNSWMKHKKNSGTPRVPYISALFVAKTFNLTTDPTHLLYKQLTMYLRLKSSFNFQCIPEFNVLFYSPEVEHQEFRQFIVEVIKHGIKSSTDLFLLVSTNTFKVLMGFYGSNMSTLDLNLQILSVFSTCVKIPASAKIMIEHVGILSWLVCVVSCTKFYQFDIIEGLISILNNLWYAIKANEKEFHNFDYLMFEINLLIISVLSLISNRISSANFTKIVNILNKSSLRDHRQYLILSPLQMGKILQCAEFHFGESTYPLRCLLEKGTTGCSSNEQYCQELYDQKVDIKTIFALSSLRQYLLKWWHHHSNLITNAIADMDQMGDVPDN